MTHKEIIQRFRGSKCPACGRELTVSVEFRDGYNVYQVICCDDVNCCVADPRRETESGAIRAWQKMFLD